MHDTASLAWIIVAAYGCGALLALTAGRSVTAKRERTFWHIAAAVLLLLGLNKQLDIQMLLTDAARSFARDGGWYEQRRIVQGVFLLAMALGTAGAAVLLTLWLHGLARMAKVAATGLMLLMGFVLLRAAAFHHIDAWVTVNVAGLRSGWWLELAGIALIGASAAVRRASVSKI